MTAQEWLDQHFPNDGQTFCPMPMYIASVPFFLEVFGPALEAALKAGTSTYDALMNVEGGTRGWEIYFEDWQRRGILS